MKKTELLELPIYDTPDIDIFDLQDWNIANQNIEKAFNNFINNDGKFDVVNEEVVEARKGKATLKEKIDEIDLSLLSKANNNDVDKKIKSISNNARKIKFKLMVSPWWRNTQTQDIIDRDIKRFKEMGVDGFALCFHISNKNGRLQIEQNLELHDYAIEKLKQEGLIVSAIKVHCVQKEFDSLTTSYEEFKVLVKQLCDRYKDKDIPYFTFLNEVPGVYNGSETKNTTLIKELATYIKSCGFLCGFSYANDLEITSTIENYPERIECIDVIGRNTYPIFGYKDKGTNYDDSLYAWKNKDNLLKKCKSLYPDKKIILTECGIQQFYESFRQPAIAISSGTPSRGETGKIFYYGLFENPSLNGLIDEVWMWFPEQQAYETFYEFIKNYTGNVRGE